MHFVPLDLQLDWCFPRAIIDRPTLCGLFVDRPGEGTSQPDLVGCWNCALAIELNREMYDPPLRPNWTTAFGLTTCSTCGGIIGYHPGCRCCKSLSQWFRQLRASRMMDRALRASQSAEVDDDIEVQAERKKKS